MSYPFSRLPSCTWSSSSKTIPVHIYIDGKTAKQKYINNKKNLKIYKIYTKNVPKSYTLIVQTFQSVLKYLGGKLMTFSFTRDLVFWSGFSYSLMQKR